jgi:hypothetical protein
VNATQKYAWFNLAVIALTLFMVLSLFPFMGQAAFGGFGVLGLLGFGVFFFRRRPGQVLADERDGLILSRSVIIAYSVFWLAFVAAATGLVPILFGQDGAVPVVVLQLSVFGAFMLFTAVMAVATLVQYARGGGHAS